MKKIIRINESNLKNVIKKIIIREQWEYNVEKFSKWLAFTMGITIGTIPSNTTNLQSYLVKILGTSTKFKSEDYYNICLNNESSEHLNVDLGIYITDFQVLNKQLNNKFTISNISESEIGLIVDCYDFPLYDKDKRNVIKFVNGQTTESESSYKTTKIPLKLRAHKVGSMVYPAVDELRRGYNDDESALWGLIEDKLGEDSALAGQSELFINCYREWIVSFSNSVEKFTELKMKNAE